MSQDLMQKAVQAVDINGAGKQWETHDGTDKSQKPHSHACCPFCGGFGCTDIAQGPDKKIGYFCKSCGKFSLKLTYRHSSGPSVSETRARSSRDLSDSELPDLKCIKYLTPAARLWLEWSQTSLYSGDHLKSRAGLENLRWFAYTAVAEQVAVNNRDDVKTLGARLLVLVEKVLESRKQGRIAYTDAELAKHIRIGRNEFGSDLRWGRIKRLVEAVIKCWEDEVVG